MTENEEKEKPPIIIDKGTGFCKAGFGEEEEPRIIYSSIVDIQNMKNACLEEVTKNFL